jgi:histidinol-phosphate aminotransferase
MIDLATNTNRWGAPPAALAAFRASAADTWRYPEPYAESLKLAIARHHGVAVACVTTGAGADGVLSAAIRALAAGASVALPDPTFEMIARFARAAGATPSLVPLGPTYDVDAEALVACNAPVVYVCSPNNPTGAPVPRSTLEWLAARRADTSTLIVDEAYADFASEDHLDLARAHDNVLVVRTFSKAYGLAGARVGYGIGAPEVIRRVEQSRGPYTVSLQGAVAAAAALSEDVEWVRRHTALAVLMRESLLTALTQRGLEPVASSANFVLLPLLGAADTARALAEQGVAVRSFTGLRVVSPALAASRGEALRISVGPWHEMERTLSALDAARSVACA